MKKKYMLLIIILIIVLILGIVIINNKKNKIEDYENKNLKEISIYKKIDVNKVKSIEIKKKDVNENPVIIVDKVKIYQIYEDLGEIRILSKTNNSKKNRTIYTFIFENGSNNKILFNNNNIVINDKEYKIEGLDNLKLE